MTMKETRPIDPNHRQIQGFLRTVGPLVLGIGLLFTAVGLISFFRAFGTFEPPHYFWCAIVGLPLTGIGIGLCKFGYLGALTRYVMGEFAPVQKDTFNNLVEGTRPGVETLARAVGQGFAAGTGRESECPRCNAANPSSARFCSQCGTSLATKQCASCGRSNPSDSQFCDQCGVRLT